MKKNPQLAGGGQEKRTMQWLLYSAGVLVTLVVVWMAATWSAYNRLSHLARHSQTIFVNDTPFEPTQTGINHLDQAILSCKLFLRSTLPISSMRIVDPDDDAMRDLAAYQGLRDLTISGGAFAPASMRVFSALTNLENVSFYSSDCISDHTLSSLGPCKNLQQIVLDLSGEVQGEFLDQLSCQDTLEELDMFVQVGFDDDDLSRLTRFKKLKRLRIVGGYFEGAGFNALSGLSRLEVIEVSIPNESASSQISHVPEIIDNTPPEVKALRRR